MPHTELTVEVSDTTMLNRITNARQQKNKTNEIKNI